MLVVSSLSATMHGEQTITLREIEVNMADDSLSNSSNKPFQSSGQYSKRKSKNIFHKVRKYISFFLLFTSVLIVIILGIFQRSLFYRVADIIKVIWPAIIAALTIFGFAVNGIIKNPPKSFTRFLENGFLQIAAWELFLFVFGLTAYAYLTSRPGVINLQLTYAKTDQKIAVRRTYNDTILVRDTIDAPSSFDGRPGNYTFEIIENSIYHDKKSGTLNPGETLLVKLYDKRIISRLTVKSTPPGAEIWINGSDTNHSTPYTFNDLERKTFLIELKLKGFEDFKDSIDLLQFEPNHEKDLNKNYGPIKLRKLYKIQIIGTSDDIELTINNKIYKGTQKEISIPEGSNIIFRVPGQSPQHKDVDINRNQTIFIP